MTTIGRKHGGERQRMYTYALVDAKDEPFVTFKYQLCTEGEYMDGERSGHLHGLMTCRALRPDAPPGLVTRRLRRRALQSHLAHDHPDRAISLPNTTESPPLQPALIIARPMHQLIPRQRPHTIYPPPSPYHLSHLSRLPRQATSPNLPPRRTAPSAPPKR